MKQVRITYKPVNEATPEDWYKFDGFILSTYPVDEMEFETDLDKTFEHTFYSENEEAVLDFIMDNIVKDKVAIASHEVKGLSPDEWDEVQARL